MSYNAKNYFAHGGAELVIGGRLTFLPGAVVEGIEGLFDTANGEAQMLPYMADSEATTVAVLRENFNSLLAILRTAGIMAAEQTETDEPVEPGDET